MKKCKIQGQVTTLQMPFTYNRESTNFSSTHVRIFVKVDATPLAWHRRLKTRFLRLVHLCEVFENCSFRLSND